MNKWIGQLIYPFFVLLSGSLNGQSPLPSHYQKVLNLQFEQVQQTSPNVTADIPGFDLYVQNLSEVTQLIFSESKAAYDSLRKNEKSRLKTLKNATTPSPYNDFFRAEIKIQWAFTKIKFGEQWGATWALRSAYKIIKRNIEQYPDFDLNYKSLGLLHVIFGAVPDSYRWVLGILGLEGDTQKGLEQLYGLLEEPTLFQKEIRLVTAMVESYLMENHEAALELMQDDPRQLSHIERYGLALVMMKSHQSARAARLLKLSLNDLPASSPALPLFHYLMAETEFQAGHYARASQHYTRFTNSFEGINHLKDAYFKLSLSARQLKNSQESQSSLQKALALKTTDAEADKNAQKLMETKPFPNFALLQVRFGIDGGYYQFADSLLQNLTMTDLPDYQQFELIYRKARLQHLQQNYEQAIPYYEQVIAKEKEMPEDYFVPNSYLQLGYLQLELGNEAQARAYFEKVLTFRKHPYKNSLDSKAKIALKGLQK